MIMYLPSLTVQLECIVAEAAGCFLSTVEAHSNGFNEQLLLKTGVPTLFEAMTGKLNKLNELLYLKFQDFVQESLFSAIHRIFMHNTSSQQMTMAQKAAIGVVSDAEHCEKVAGLSGDVTAGHAQDLLSSEDTDPVLNAKMALVNDVSIIMQTVHGLVWNFYECCIIGN